MTTCAVQLTKKFPNNEAMLARLRTEINLLRRLKVSSVKVQHGSASESDYIGSRLLCRQFLHEMLVAGEVQSLCIGESFSPFEVDGRQIAALDPSLRQDPDWGKRNDAIVMLVL